MMLRRIALLAALLAVPLVVGAQTVVQDGQPTRGVQQVQLGGHLYRADSTGWANTGDGSGNLYTTEASPDRNFLYKYQSIIQQSLFRVAQCQAAPTTCTFALPQADSSSARLMLGATRAALAITYTMDTDSTCGALLCVEVRGHLTENADSVSTFLWNWKDVAAATVDTVGAQATTVAGAGVGAFTTTALDTTNVAPTEKAVWLNKYSPYRAIWLPITNRNTGEFMQAPYMSVKVRIIKVYGSTACTAWTGKAGPRTTVNVDLVGWR